MIKGSIRNAPSLLKKLSKMAAVMEEKRNKAVQESTLALHAEAVKIVSENAGGDVEIRYNPKRTVTVSKPGEPPHTDTGRLRQSIKFDFKDKGATGRVGSNYKVAAWLEFGTEHIGARPWLSVAVENVSKTVADIFEKWTKGAIKEVTK